MWCELLCLKWLDVGSLSLAANLPSSLSSLFWTRRSFSSSHWTISREEEEGEESCLWSVTVSVLQLRFQESVERWPIRTKPTSNSNKLSLMLQAKPAEKPPSSFLPLVQGKAPGPPRSQSRAGIIAGRWREDVHFQKRGNLFFGGGSYS